MSFPAVIAWIARIVVGGLFILAGVMKILDPLHFAEEIQAYRMVPPEITHALAFMLPWLEVFAGAMLVVGLWRGEARLTIFVMTIIFTAAKISAEARGLRISCGCFGSLLGPLEQALSGVNGIILNVVLCGLLAADFFASRPLSRRTETAPEAKEHASSDSPRPRSA